MKKVIKIIAFSCLMRRFYTPPFVVPNYFQCIIRKLADDANREFTKDEKSEEEGVQNEEVSFLLNES